MTKDQKEQIRKVRDALSVEGVSLNNELMIQRENCNSKTTLNNNLPPSLDRANMPSIEVLGQPDATIDRPLEKRCYTVEDLQVMPGSSSIAKSQERSRVTSCVRRHCPPGR